MSLFRISLICSSHCLLALVMLPPLLLAQQDFGYPSTGAARLAPYSNSGSPEFGVSSPSFPDTQLPSFVDHSSMSPDSWSAPPTGPQISVAPAAEQNMPPIQTASAQIAAPTPASPFFRTPFGGFQATNQPGINAPVAQTAALAPSGNAPRASLNPGIESESNSFQTKRPELLKFDARDALSNFSESESKSATPNVPELQSDSPFKLGKTTSDSYREASLQSGFAPNPNSSRLEVPSGIAPLETGPATAMPTPNGLLMQSIPYQNPVYSGQPQQQLLTQPGFVGQSMLQANTQPYPGQSSWGYPAQPNPIGIQQPPGAYPGSEMRMLPNTMGKNPMMPSGANFRPDLGYRSPMPTTRNFGSYDDGQRFEFEDKKKQYPPMSEILATGRYFGSFAAYYVRLHAQDNTAFTTNSATFTEGITFDYDYELAPVARFGFESKFGPGIEFDYFKHNGKSNQAQFTSNGAVTGQIQTLGSGASQFGAFNAGETLEAQHSVNFETFGVSFFKEVKLPISRVNGRFGFQYTSIAQNLDANLVDATGEIGTFNSRSDFRGIGPKFTLEYYRPVGHTPLEFVTTVAGGVTYGRRDQFVDNTLDRGFSRVGADEFLTTIEFNSGIQFKRNLAENRSVFARLGATYSTWLGGGSAIDPQSDFGLRGFSFTVGYNR